MEKNKFQIRTDLAIEAREIHSELDGAKVHSKNFGDITTNLVRITNDYARDVLQKPIGDYFTLECKSITDDPKLIDNIISILAKQISKFIGNHQTVLVVGLGNRNVTPDSLGPKVSAKIVVTRHISDSKRKVSSIAPGVLGLTGIETHEVIRGLVDKTKPDVVIAIDALAARSISRINSTIQICNTGIKPGSGVGNMQRALNRETLGVDVISIGVPTVIDAATLVNDTMELILSSMESAMPNDFFYSAVKSLTPDEKYHLITQILNPYNENMFVTPKEVDYVIEQLTEIISSAINVSLHGK